MPSVRLNKNMYQETSIVDNQDYYDESDDIIEQEEQDDFQEDYELDYELENYQGHRDENFLQSTVQNGFTTGGMFGRSTLNLNMSSSYDKSYDKPSLSVISSSVNTEKTVLSKENTEPRMWEKITRPTVNISLDYSSYPILGYVPPSKNEGFTQVSNKTQSKSPTTSSTRVITRKDMPKLVRQIGI